jgi:hypothetical protein
LGYLKEFGTFDFDVVVIVLNSEDAWGVIDGKPKVGVLPEFPDRKPISALWEGIDRYGGPLWWKVTHLHPQPEGPDMPPADELNKDEAVCSDAVKEMIELARGNHVPHVMVAQYLFQAEVAGDVKQGHGVLLAAIRSEGIEPEQLGEVFKRAVQSGEIPFGDIRHPNALGHQIIGEELAKGIEAEIGQSSTKPTKEQ